MSTGRVRGLAAIIVVAAVAPATAVLGMSSAAAATHTGGHTTLVRHGLGLTPVAHQQVARPRVGAGVTVLPAAVDLSAWAVPVGDQGALSSCVTWAIDYAMLGWYSRRQGHVGEPFAPMYAYSQIEAANGWQDEGADVDEAYTIAEQQGIDTQADYPQGSYDWRDLPTAAQHAAAAAHKTTGFHYLYASWPDPAGAAAQPAIEGALAAGHPVAVSIPVYSRFERLSSTSDTMTAADATGTLLGYHEVLAIGYDATGVRIQNSWGTGWGDRGFATLGWDFVAGYTLDASVMTGFVDVPAVNPVVAPVVTPTVTPTVVPVPVPTVDSIDPAQGPSYGGTTVTIHGADLSGVTGVTFGSNPATTFTAVDDSTVTAVAPAADGVSDVDVRVTTSGGVSAAVGADRFSYLTPAVTSVSPAAGSTAGGSTITLTGSALSLVTQVSFGDVPAQRWWHVGDTAIAAVTPAHAAGAAPVVVTAGPTDTVVGAFRYVGAPVVKHVTRHGHRRLDIWGRDLSTTTRVHVGARIGRILQVRSNRHIVVALPAGAGRVQVRVATRYGRSRPSAASRFRYAR